MQILEEELAARNGKLEEAKQEDASLSEIHASHHIEENYISHDEMRIEMHKKIDKISSMKDLEALKDELKDRFGSYENELLYYMYDKLFNNLCKKVGVYKIENAAETISLCMSIENSVKIGGSKMFSEAVALTKNIKLTATSNILKIVLNKKSYKSKDYLIELCKYLEKISS